MHFATGQYDEACALVKRYHYSGRVPSGTRYVVTAHRDGGLFGNMGPAIAAVFICVTQGGRWAEDVLELARLVRCDDAKFQLTRLISITLKHMRREGEDLIISYADATQDHHGGIYQAASWIYHGKRDASMDGLLINSTFVAGRTCNERYGTRSPSKLRSLFPEWDIEPHYDEGKYLYWKALNRSGKRKAKRLGLKSHSYPKPDLIDEPAAPSEPAAPTG